MYANVWSHVCVDEGYSDEFEVKVGVHQGSVLSLLLFIIVLMKPCDARSAVGSPGRTSMPMTLLSLLNHLRNVSGGWTWKEAMKEKDKMQER